MDRNESLTLAARYEFAEVLRDFRERKQRALARAISWAEAGRGAELIRAVYASTGRAMTIGLTGPPGVGKSTLSSALVRTARAHGKSVGVVSVDPTSPFSHGALLGDRIRLDRTLHRRRRLHSLDGERAAISAASRARRPMPFY